MWTPAPANYFDWPGRSRSRGPGRSLVVTVFATLLRQKALLYGHLHQ